MSNTVLNNGHKFDDLTNLAAKLKTCWIDPTIDISEPPTVLLIDDRPIATLGNFSLLIGKAKSKKTFLMISLLAACVKPEIVFLDKIRAKLPINKQMVLHFDTEMSNYHALKAVKKVCKLSGIATPNNYKAYGLRKYPPNERLDLIEHAIYNTPDLVLVAIDGLRDLLTKGINDEAEATEIISKLMKWTAEKDIHIILVLHQNKGDLNARGHVGTEAVNKSESVISITKDGKNDSISIVEAEFTRDINFEPFAFTINDEGLPIECDMPNETNQKSTVTPEIITLEQHFLVLAAIFKDYPDQKWKELILNIISGFSEYDISFGQNKARDFITYYKNKEWIKLKDGGYQYTRPIF